MERVLVLSLLLTVSYAAVIRVTNIGDSITQGGYDVGRGPMFSAVPIQGRGVP